MNIYNIHKKLVKSNISYRCKKNKWKEFILYKTLKIKLYIITILDPIQIFLAMPLFLFLNQNDLILVKIKNKS